MWPTNRNNDDTQEEEEQMSVPPLDVDDGGAFGKPPNKRQESVGSQLDDQFLFPGEIIRRQISGERRSSESAEAYQRRTRTELNLMQRNNQAADMRKSKKEQEQAEKERIRQEKRERAKKLREKAKKAGGKRKKKKKKKKQLAASQCAVGDVVLSQKGIAVVRWKGILHFRPNDVEWLGIEFLDEPHGKNNGSVKGVEYFKCKKNHGSFVKTVSKKLEPEEILRKLGTVKSQLHQKEKDINEIKDQMDELLLHQERLQVENGGELEKLPEVPMAGDDKRGPSSGSASHLQASTLKLAQSISGSIDRAASPNKNPVVASEFILKLGEVYDDDSSSEYSYIDSDYESEGEEEVQGLERHKSDRKKLIDAAQSQMYSEGSLRRIQDELLEQMEVLKAGVSGEQTKAPGLNRQATFAGTRELGLDLPELHATSEEVEEWIKTNLVKAPGCPDLDNQQVLSALTWAMRAFLNLNESHTY